MSGRPLGVDPKQTARVRVSQSGVVAGSGHRARAHQAAVTTSTPVRATLDQVRSCSFTRCATPGCRCHADPPQPHGPYYQWTTKIDGKTVTRRLNPHEATLYQEWIDNDRKMRRLIAQMRQIAAQASQIHLAAAARD